MRAFLGIILLFLIGVCAWWVATGNSDGHQKDDAEEVFRNQSAEIASALQEVMLADTSPVVSGIAIIRMAKGETTADSTAARVKLEQRLKEWQSDFPSREVVSVRSVTGFV